MTAGAAFPHPQVARTLPAGFDSRLWTVQGLVAPVYPNCNAGTVGELESASAVPAIAGAALVGQLEAISVKVGISTAGTMGQTESVSVVHHP